jgi:vitamin B12/bleomycin/antimicrobial peptide transport system ATP-binding/permease protein
VNVLPVSNLVDPKDYSINVRFFRRMLGLLRPYWMRRGAWRSWLVFGVCTGYSIAEAALGAKLSFVTRELNEALVERHVASYWHLLIVSTLIGLVIGTGVLSQFVGFVYDWLALHWRSWLTTQLVRDYLRGRTYYRIEQDGDIDNVDQRIQQEVGGLCGFSIIFSRILLHSVLNMGVQGWILRTISPILFYGVIAYGLLTALIVGWLQRPMIRLNFDSTASEADLRFGILNVRNHAETVALYRGERAEELSIAARLTRTVRIALATLRYRFVLGLADSGMGIIWTLLPVVILVPQYFTGRINYGVVMQGTVSAAMLLAAIRGITGFVPLFAASAPHVVRLAQIVEKSNSVNAESNHRSSTISLRNGYPIRLDNIRLQTPGRERVLLDALSLEIRPGEHLMIIGQTGLGKSSLLRAMAGLWREGEGMITMPPPDEMLFLPQRPYMLLGSLREQLLYPAPYSDLSDQQLQALLDQVALPDLARIHGGFDAVIDWSRVLSLGEQQRIGFARVLAARPRYVFLDEATSAVDVATERKLYSLLLTSGATFVSVGHRSSLLAYHVKILELISGGGSRILTAEQARIDATALQNANSL